MTSMTVTWVTARIFAEVFETARPEATANDSDSSPESHNQMIGWGFLREWLKRKASPKAGGKFFSASPIEVLKGR